MDDIRPDNLETNDYTDTTGNTSFFNTTSNKSTDDKKSNLITILIYTIFIVVVIVCLYYAYQQFTENCNSENFSKNPEQERTDPIMDFNLQETIFQLNKQQNNILKGLSNESDI